MEYDRELIAHKLQRWDKFITDYHLPDWDSIPDFGLYMDQVIVLLEQYLSFIPAPVGGKERFVTSSTINNYVRLKIMPAPEKRKYHRIHIAYLIMICTLKQSLRLSMLSTLLPGDLPEEDVKRAYAAFVLRHQRCAKYFIEQVRLTAAAMFDREVTTELNVRDTPEMIVSAAILSGFTNLFAEKLMLLEGKTLADGGSIEVQK